MSVGSYGGYQPAIAGADYPAGPIAWQAGQSWPLRLPPRVYAVDMNQQLSAAVSFLAAKPQFKGAQWTGSGQSIANNTAVPVNLDTEIDDAWGMHANSGDSSQIVVPAGCDGVWLVQGVCSYNAASSGGMFAAQMGHNGVPGVSGYYTGEKMAAWGGGSFPIPQALELFPAVAGDYFQLSAYQITGASVSLAINTAPSGGIQFDRAYYPFVTARWIGANNSLPGGVMSIPFIQGDGTWFANENVQLSVPGPHTWTSNEQATSAKFNSDILNSVLFLSNVPFCRAVAGSPASIASGTAAQVTSMSATLDNWGAFASNTWTAPVSGLYLVMGQVTWPGQASAFQSYADLHTTISGVTSDTRGAMSWGTVNGSISVRTIRFTAGDTVKLYGYQNFGSSLTPTTDSKLITVWLSA